MILESIVHITIMTATFKYQKTSIEGGHGPLDLPLVTPPFAI